MDGGMEGGGGEGTAGGRGIKDEMKVELGVDGLIEDEQLRFRKHYLRLGFLFLLSAHVVAPQTSHFICFLLPSSAK